MTVDVFMIVKHEDNINIMKTTTKNLIKNKNPTEIKQEARGACGAHLVLTNPLGFVGFFFLVQNSIYIFGIGNYGTIQNTLFMQM